MASNDRALDPEALKLFSFNVFSQLSGAVTAGMIHIGDQLGLYRILAASDGMTSNGIADASNLSERWVREWCANQVAARIVVAEYSYEQRESAEHVDENTTYKLTPEAVAVLANEEHPAFGMGMFHRLPATFDRLKDLPESFRTGIGFDYDAHGPEGAVGIERSFEPWSNAFLVNLVLPAMTGIVDKLKAGISVVDIGCGAGSAVLLMAQEFPQSTFIGIDISEHALARASEKLAQLSLSNVSFINAKTAELPKESSVDFVTTFDCIHDMTHPRKMIEDIYRMLKEDGSWLLVDIKAGNTLQENVSKNPMAALMYGISVLSCMASALSDHNGEGLGTLGLPSLLAEDFAHKAGFNSFRQLDISHSVNAFYEIQK